MTADESHELIAKALEVDIGVITSDLAYGDISEWSSLAHVNLMLALEARLSVEIGPDQMVELANVAAIDEFVVAHQPDNRMADASAQMRDEQKGGAA